MIFAEWVHDTRVSFRLTQEECATRAGIEQPSWKSYEDRLANRVPRPETIKKIAFALGVSEDDALQAAGRTPKAKSKADDLISRRLTPKLSLIPESRLEQVVRMLERDIENYAELAAA